MKPSYVFVGSGPSSIIAANLLAADFTDIFLLDAGARHQSRSCLGLRDKTCTSCAGSSCHVTNGIGGASAEFGNKICHFPASDRILSLLPGSLLPEVYRQMGEITGLQRVENATNVIPHTGSAARKVYPADILTKNEYQAVIARLIERLPDTVSIRENTAVVDVEAVGRGFRLGLSDGSMLETENLVFACGRSGHRFLRRAFTKLGVAFDENAQDVGFRLEAASELFSDQFLYQNDPKYKFTHSSLGSSRTFCTCKGGTIVPVKYGKGFFADGAFFNQPTGRTNVALMVRGVAPLSDQQVDTWCADVNASAEGNLLVAEFDLAEVGRLSFVEGVLERMRWPTDAHKTMMRELLDNIVLGRYVKMFEPAPGKDNRVRVFGPSVDHYWPAPVLSQGFRTTTSGISVIGDATGASRGIMQALASGAGWALMEAARMSRRDAVIG